MSYLNLKPRRSNRKKTESSFKRREPVYREDVLKIVKTNFCSIPKSIRIENFDVEKEYIEEGQHDIKWDICHENEPPIAEHLG